MADQPRHPEPPDNPAVEPDRGSPPRAPRWVKAAAIIVVVLVLVFVLLRLAGVGGEHGPGRHMSGSGTPVSVTQERASSSVGQR